MSSIKSSPWIAGLLTCLALVISGCSGSTGPQGPAGVSPDPTPPKDDPTPIVTRLDRDQDLPGALIEIQDLAGGTGDNGNFLPGDNLSVTFSIKMKDGTDIPIAELDSGGILVSGPTSNYQRVFGYQRDLRDESIANSDGTYTYTFATAIPPTYLAPYNDTASFGPSDGEMTGKALISGTYTVGIEVYKSYTVEAESFRDAGNDTHDFLLGNAARIDRREVVTLKNCNQCHVELRAHGTIRRNLTHCLLCHTAGAEDKNVATAAGGTPGVSIDFKVMIHKIHSGAKLPSVLGVTTGADGARIYDAKPKPYQLVGYRDSVHDYSDVVFPVWPNLSNPLPRDQGYSALTRTQQGLEDQMRGGAATCAKCHGDPDGAGPAPAPDQGYNAYSQPTRAACGSCHDDIDWNHRYRANDLFMPPQADDATCLKCHVASANVLGTVEGHRHPILDPQHNPGLVFAISKVSEAGTHNGNGKLDPGEAVSVEFSIKDEAGNDVAASQLSRMEVVVAGPTANRQMLLEELFPVAAVAGSTVKTMLPQKVYLQYTQKSTSRLDLFRTFRRHWNVSGGSTTVRATLPIMPTHEMLAGPAREMQNYIDLNSTPTIARGDYIVIDHGLSTEEYLRVQLVEGQRLWFSSSHSPYSQPGLRFAHHAGATVSKLSTSIKKAGVDYQLNPQTGDLTELIEFGDGYAVLVSYTTDFVIPKKYGLALNASPDQDASWGKWTGLPILDGTYSVALWGERDFTVKVGNDSTAYHGAAQSVSADFLVGAASTVQPRAMISSAQNCYNCHNEIWFHGSHRRGLESCLICHGTAGAEDRPQYVAPNAPATTAVSIDFRRMLHRIHKGKDLANASTYLVNGYGRGYPNNYTAHSYEQVGFPVMRGGIMNCRSCHGSGTDVWTNPVLRNHPLQTRDTRSWYIACGSCHDSNAALAHMDTQTSARGAEACATCHGVGRTWDTTPRHKVR